MKQIKFLAFVAVLMMAAACSEPLNEAAEELSPQNEGAETPKMSHWGNKSEDPYSVSNMRLAFKELMKTSEGSLSKAGVTEAQIVPTHLHLKFIPKNEEEMDLLRLDTILDVVPIPFNYDLENFDGVYRDPECPANQPTYQYSVVRIGHELPKVEYEVLDSLFMPYEDEYEDKTISKSTISSTFWDRLEEESFILTGNMEDDDEHFSVAKKKRVTPDGYVKMTDFSASEITRPVPNVRVHMNFSTHRSNARTDANGYFKMPNSFRSRVHTHVYFENTNYHACEKNGSVVAYYRGRVKMEKNELLLMDKKNNHNYAATIMVAAYEYYNNTLNVKCPPKDKNIPIGLKTKNNGYATLYTTEFGGHYIEDQKDRIFIVESAACKDKTTANGNKEGTYVKGVDEDIYGKNMEIYATTMYGLAYVSLKNFAKSFWPGDPSLLNESYCACIAYVFANNRYGDLYNPSEFRKNYSKYNSGFFIDMIDGLDAANEDYVQGYTIQQIEGLIATKKITALRDVVAQMHNYCTNSTSDKLNILQTHWQSWAKLW